MKEELIVSLTTWKARIGNLPAVLDTIYAQTLPPDKVVLNLAFEEEIPCVVQNYLERRSVEVNRVPDTKVYKKLIPTLKKYPQACVVNIDDDWLYPQGMLEDFMNVHRLHPGQPVSGNREQAFHMDCHCGCASLTKREYFGKYLDCIDEDLIRHCPSDDLVYTYLIKKNGLDYVHTEGLYFDNLMPYSPVEPYTAPCTPLLSTWEYLQERFTAPGLRYFLRYCLAAWFFELNRDSKDRKFLRLFGIKIYLDSFPKR